MLRAIDLANLSDREVKSNPPVGCVIVEDGIIIGEGRHEKYGEAHAEVNAYQDVLKNGRNPGENSEVYVTLEPCGHHGKTPPCAELIASFHPKAVHLFEKDRHPVTSEKGLEILKINEVSYDFPKLEGQSSLLDRFYKNSFSNQPWIILKYTQTADHFIGSNTGRIQISDPYTSRLTHKLRSQCDGILIGRNTLEMDDPELNNRYWSGPSPQRFVVGNSFSKPLKDFKVFHGEAPAILITTSKEQFEGIKTIHLDHLDWEDLWKILYEEHGICQLLIEGGSKILQSIIDADAWDEARVITNRYINAEADIAAPVLSNNMLLEQTELIHDEISIFRKDKNQ